MSGQRKIRVLVVDDSVVMRRVLSEVVKSDPDGYTLVTSSSSMATERVLHKKLVE